ncbi:uncharacterized protein LOC130761292 [Actinidia eriantha]|nr:uncharacterized protein LOC130761292 [Actinidia eriantha]
MDPRYAGEMFEHLEKQTELLKDAYRSMTHELHKLQVEEEMLMRKFYELMEAQGLTKKNEENSSNVPGDGKNKQSGALVPVSNNEQ